MLRQAFLFLSTQRWAARLLSGNPVTRALPWRFVAGETLDAALGVARRLERRRIRTILDPLGENVTQAADAVAAADAVIAALRSIKQVGTPTRLSVKLTQLGLDLGDDFCRAQVRRVLDCARVCGSHVCIDMEGSAYTQRTLDIFDGLHEAYGPGVVGTVVQSYLYRSQADLERLVQSGAQVRLVKGAYNEPPSLAYAAKADVDRAYARQTELLLARGTDPAIATHDWTLIRHALGFVHQNRVPPERFEFQLLFGVRRDLQDRLAGQGYGVRVYVPYGTQWYPYFMRRLAERPANVVFLLQSALREARPARTTARRGGRQP